MSIWDKVTADDVKNSSNSDFTKIMPVGNHRVQVVEFFEDVSKNCSIVTFQNRAGEEIRDYFYATIPALWRVNDFRKALGVSENKAPREWFSERGLLHKVVEITVVEEEYNGKTRKKVKSYKAAAAPVAPAPIAPPPMENTDNYNDIPF